MMLIRMSNGGDAIVDAEHHAYLSTWSWHRTKKGYARRNSEYREGYMHRTILKDILGVKIGKDQEVDHINRNKLDNRVENLRVVDRSVNRHNGGPYKSSTSGVRGVTFNKQKNRWTAIGTINKKTHRLGQFASFDEAIKARKAWERDHCLASS